MATITFITGGARSGKSSYAQARALECSNNPVYIATARIWDEDFQKRVNRHRDDRDERWRLIEKQTELSAIGLENEVVVIDCVTLWLTNLFTEEHPDIEQCLADIRADFSRLANSNNRFFVISNEIGMGLHAHTEAGRKFTDLQGWTNQFIAGMANEVILMVSGLPLTVKNTLL